jgi:hypothetical protein
MTRKTRFAAIVEAAREESDDGLYGGATESDFGGILVGRRPRTHVMYANT